MGMIDYVVKNIVSGPTFLFDLAKICNKVQVASLKKILYPQWSDPTVYPTELDRLNPQSTLSQYPGENLFELKNALMNRIYTYCNEICATAGLLLGVETEASIVLIVTESDTQAKMVNTSIDLIFPGFPITITKTLDKAIKRIQKKIYKQKLREIADEYYLMNLNNYIQGKNQTYYAQGEIEVEAFVKYINYAKENKIDEKVAKQNWENFKENGKSITNKEIMCTFEEYIKDNKLNQEHELPVQMYLKLYGHGDNKNMSLIIQQLIKNGWFDDHPEKENWKLVETWNENYDKLENDDEIQENVNFKRTRNYKGGILKWLDVKGPIKWRKKLDLKAYCWKRRLKPKNKFMMISNNKDPP